MASLDWHLRRVWQNDGRHNDDGFVMPYADNAAAKAAVCDSSLPAADLADFDE